MFVRLLTISGARKSVSYLPPVPPVIVKAVPAPALALVVASLKELSSTRIAKYVVPSTRPEIGREPPAL